MNCNNLCIHKSYWLLLTLFPVMSNVTGGVGVSQKLMHVFFILFTLFVIFVKQVKSIRVNKYHVTFIFFILAYMLLVILFNNEKFAAGDSSDVIRPLIYFFYLMIPVLFPVNEEEFKKLFKFMIYLLTFQIIFSVLVYISSLWPIVDLYKGRMSTDKVFFHFLRLSGTFGYPSDFSFYLSFYLYFYFFYLLHYYRFGLSEKRNILKMFLLFLVLVLTVSRGGIGTVIIMLTFILLFYSFKYKKIYRLLIRIFGYLILIMSTLITLLVIINSEETLRFISYLQLFNADGDKIDGSTNHRINEFLWGWHYFLEYFPFGPGPNRTEISTHFAVVESFYGLYMLKWGLVGLLLYYYFVAYMVKIAIHTLSLYNDIFIQNFTKSFIVLMISVILVFGFSSAISDRFKGLPFFYLTAGYVYMLYRNKKDLKLKKF